MLRVGFLNTLNQKQFEKYDPKKCSLGDVSQILKNNQSFKICLWVALTMVRSLLLNSALLKIRIPALASNCSYEINKIREPVTLC